MAYTSLMQTVWSKRLLANLDKSLVYAALTNSSYEGDAANASVVRINTIGSVTIGNYDPSTGTGNAEDISSTSIDLNIDQKKFFNFKVEDVLKASTNIELVNNATSRAAYGLAEEIDRFIAALYTGVNASNIIGDDTTPKVVGLGGSDVKPYDLIVALGTKLHEANVTGEGRFVVISPWILCVLAKDARFTTNPTVLANGIVEGQNIAGMKIAVSNNVPNLTGTKYKIIAGTPDAIGFASALKSIESYRPEKQFADAVKGLHVFGAKLLYDKGIAVATVNKGTI